MKWVEKPSDSEAGVGKPVIVPCKAEGSPAPTIEWFKIDDEVRLLGSELRFASVSQQDAGYYECRAKNGQDEELVSRMKLSVLGKYICSLGQSLDSIKLLQVREVPFQLGLYKKC